MTPRNTTRHGFTTVYPVILDFAAHFKEISELIPDCICKRLRYQKRSQQYDNRKKLDSHYLVSKTQYKSTVFKTLWYWSKDTDWWSKDRQNDGKEQRSSDCQQGGSFICDNQKMQTRQMSTNRWIGSLWYIPPNSMPHSTEEE